ncbi:MAG: hypothetical protein ETSY2_05980 [Candidatus Entotheonella gemina]|uniref:Uncharacterized protein n=1 Tax=Candidatus Entotheonella gemina TaxID=1429439 RepID=W4MDE1_9BACT|nr:MAG: hypothetical protein ETSY2_05980 [Candidatus Entotheonella gemina]
MRPGWFMRLYQHIIAQRLVRLKQRIKTTMRCSFYP